MPNLVNDLQAANMQILERQGFEPDLELDLDELEILLPLPTADIESATVLECDLTAAERAQYNNALYSF